MGKGNRVRLKKAQSQAEQSSAFAKKEKKQTPTWVWTLATILIVVLLLSSVALSVINNGGYILRWTKVVESENYSVDAAMLSYYFKSYYMDFYTTYGSAFGSYLNPSVSLKAQSLGTDGQSWFDYLMADVIKETEKLLVYCEEADARGIKLTDEDKNDIEDTIKTIRDAAKEANYTVAGYVAAVYGPGVKLSDIRRALELTKIATKCGEVIAEEIKNGVTDADIDSYYNEHKTDFWTAQVLSYSFSAAATDSSKENYDFDAEKAKVDEKIAALVATKTEEEFRQVLCELLADGYFDSEYEDHAEEYSDEILPDEAALANYKSQIITSAVANALKGKDTPATDSADELTKMFNEIESEITEALKSVLENLLNRFYSYTDDEDNEAGLWVSDEARVSGDTKSFSETDETTGKYTSTAYMVVEPMHRDDTVTRNIGHILFTADKYGTDEKAKAKAEEILAEFKKSEMTRENFEKLGEEYTEDSSIFYDNVTRYYMVDSFDSWLFAEGRKEGDTDIVETEYGYHIMYYLGEGDIAWRVSVKNTVINNRSEEWYKSKSDQFGVKSHTERADRVVA